MLRLGAAIRLVVVKSWKSKSKSWVTWNANKPTISIPLYAVAPPNLTSGAIALTYLLTYTVGSGRIKPYTGFRLRPKRMTLNNLWARFKVTDSLNAAKITKYSLAMTQTPCRVAGALSLLGLRIHAPVHLLTYLHRIASVLATGLWSSFLMFRDWFVFRSTAFGKP